MKSLRIAEGAKADLRDVKQYTELTWGAAPARRYLDEFRARFTLLRQRPRPGRSREELGTALRSLPSGAHVILYRDVNDRSEIVRVLHASMDVRRHLKAAARPRRDR